jgi:hypothetical protein
VVVRGRAREHEHAAADDAADAEHEQIERAEAPGQIARALRARVQSASGRPKRPRATRERRERVAVTRVLGTTEHRREGGRRRRPE